MLFTRRRLFGLGGALCAPPALAAGAASAAPVALLRGAPIAGDAYYDCRKAWPEYRAGARLTLRREPGNRHDWKAIEVFSPAGHKLGYLPRRSNEPVARLMDSGRAVCACIVAVHEHRDPRTGALGWLEPRIDVLLA